MRRDAEICTVVARITPEHKVNSKAYFVTLKCNEEDERIISIQCEGCVASLGKFCNIFSSILF